MKIKILLTLTFLLLEMSLYSQNTISGVIIDLKSEPVGFSNVVLYKSDTKELVKGVVSDDNGRYLLTDVLKGTYYLEISFWGYKTQRSSFFSFEIENDTIVQNFILEEESEILDEVVIKSKRPQIKLSAGKLVVDLEQSEMVSFNLQDVMKKIPGIIVSNGNITYGGQQGVKILINGKSTDYMDITSLLRDFPAENISKVELIQQPGAEFDANGSGPIINILLKKNVELGTNGNIKLNTGYDNRPEYGLSGSISRFKNKINWQTSIGYKKTSWREDLFITRRVKDEIYDQANISPYKPKTVNWSGGLDYYLNDKHTIGVGASFINSESNRSADNSTSILSPNSYEELYTRNSYNRSSKTYNFNPYYKYEDEKNKLSLDFYYIDYKNDNVNDLYKVESKKISFNNQRYYQNGKYEILTYQADYKRTVDESFNWQVGMKFSNVKTNNDLESMIQNSKAEFILNEEQSNHFYIDEELFASYVKLVKEWNKWSISGGIRWENSNTKGTSTNPYKTKSRKISKLFPSLSIDRKINEHLGANLSYSYRILRPSYNSLNSFIYYYDPYTFEQGNPNLSPEFTNSIQFNLTYDNQPFFSIGYNTTKDAMFEIITQNDESAQTSRSMINLSKRENLNFKAFAPLNCIDNLEGYSGIIVNYNSFKSSSLQPKLDLSKWIFTWYTNVSYKLPWDINSDLTGYYTSGGLQGQIEHDWLVGLSFALGKKFMRDKLKVNLGIEEILNRKFYGSINYSNIDADVVSNWSRQNVYFQVTYNFGSNFNKKKEKSNPSEEEQSRIKSNN